MHTYIVLLNPALSSYVRATLQLHTLPVDCARELFKPLVSLTVCNEKHFSYSWQVMELQRLAQRWQIIPLKGKSNQCLRC